MESKYFAVIDTNVIVSALIAKSPDSNPVKIIRAITQERIIPLFNDEILDEYRTVLSRARFQIDPVLIRAVLDAFIADGLSLERTPAIEEEFPDVKDIVFYEVVLSREDSYLVTGNIKHFPSKPFVVTPAQMVAILERQPQI